MSVSVREDIADPENTAVYIVEKFLCLPRWGNAWLHMAPVRVYMRRSKRLIDPSSPYGRVEDFTDIGAIEVEEGYRGQGYFTELVGTLLALGHNVLVECVHNERLRSHLERTGWNTLPHDPLSFYKISV